MPLKSDSALLFEKGTKNFFKNNKWFLQYFTNLLIKFILKTGEMVKDNLPNNKLKIGSDMGHYGFSINKQLLEIKEDNMSAYVLRKNSNIYTRTFNFFIHIHINSFSNKKGVKNTSLN